MIKMKTLAFMTILMLALTGCGKEKQESKNEGEIKQWQIRYLAN